MLCWAWMGNYLAGQVDAKVGRLLCHIAKIADLYLITQASSRPSTLACL